VVAKLQLPPFDSLDIVDEVISERVYYTDFYDALKDDWKASVINYIENFAEPSIILPLDIESYLSQESIEAEAEIKPNKRESTDPKIRLTQKRKKSLIGLYSPKENKKPYDVLEKLRRKHGLLFCPSCGESGKPGTLDHYLPKSDYPELSVVVANLTPMCSECQGRKGADYINDQGEKLFIHPYFDAIDNPLVSVNIHPPFNKPQKFEVNVNDYVEEPLYSLVLRHIDGVDFIERFEEFCQLEYFNLLSLINDERLDEGPENSAQIIKRFLKKAEKQSVNRWEATFYRGILENTALLEYLDDGELPEHL
jgi:5-methylcytosine-specific restriction endonuclease McrA